MKAQMSLHEHVNNALRSQNVAHDIYMQQKDSRWQSWCSGWSLNRGMWFPAKLPGRAHTAACMKGSQACWDAGRCLLGVLML